MPKRNAKTRKYKKELLLAARAHLPPGAAHYVGPEKSTPVKINIISYDKSDAIHAENVDLDSLEQLIKPNMVNWILIEGVHNAEVVAKLSDYIGLSQLLAEDIQNIAQRPKVESFDSSLFVVAKAIGWDIESCELAISQISLIWKDNIVVSFAEAGHEHFDAIARRIIKNTGRVRTMTSNYLLYSLLDDIIDDYFVALEKYGESLEDLEDDTVNNPTQDKLYHIYSMRRQGMEIRRATWPMREMISNIIREESSLITKQVLPYYHDLYDHSYQILDTVETYRESLSGLLDMYLSSISNRMNEVMKVLTMIATIFIPLSFIAGLYGMNFKYMPELDWPWAYPAVLGIMGAIAICMLVYFKKKRWL